LGVGGGGNTKVGLKKERKRGGLGSKKDSGGPTHGHCTETLFPEGGSIGAVGKGNLVGKERKKGPQERKRGETSASRPQLLARKKTEFSLSTAKRFRS